MSIRAARADDLWRTVFARKYRNRYDALEFTDLFCLGSGAAHFHGGISAIVGGNGVGKSTLAAALGELLEREIAERYVGERSRLAGSQLKAYVCEGDAQKSRTAAGGIQEPRTLYGEQLDTESWWLDAGYWAFHTRRQVVTDQNFADVLEPVEPIELDKDQLQTLGYVVGKQYERCQIFEVPDYAGFDRFPYFKVEANGITYGSEGMGQGELALVLVLWVLRDLRPNSILILEEPESHVSPRSQAALMNVIAETVATKGIWTIITTHSPTIIDRVPTEHLRVLVRGPGGTQLIEEVRRHHAAAILGAAHGFRAVALVEDDVSKELVVAILDEFAPDLLRQLEILGSGGESKISAALAAMPKSDGHLRLIGVYDGDQRDRVNVETLNWPIVFLPGDSDPAQMLRNALSLEGGIDRFVNELRRDRNSVVTILDILAGVETRDWIIECVKTLLVTKQELVRALLRVLLNSSGARDGVTDFVGALTATYDSLK